MITSLQSNSKYPQAFIHETARVHESVEIGPFSLVEANVEIGEGTVIDSNVTLKKGVKIGRNCYIQAGVVISADVRQLEYWRKDDTTNKSINGINPLVKIGDEVHIEPNVSIHGEISIGNRCWIGSHVTIFDGAKIGDRCKIFPSAVLAAIPQDLKFEGERTSLEIGENTTIRECATLNRGTLFRGKTQIGKNVLIMAYVHVAHDCSIGDNVIISNAVNIAGHVEIEDHVVVGGVSAFHQFVKVGRHAFVAGGSLVRKDVPPYVKAGREPLQYDGVNSIGLRRRGFSTESINLIQEIYRHIFLSGKNTANALDYIEAHLPATIERDEVISFIRNAERGIIKGHKNANGHLAE